MSKTQLQVRISVEDKAEAKEAAEGLGETLSEFIRKAISQRAGLVAKMPENE